MHRLRQVDNQICITEDRYFLHMGLVTTCEDPCLIYTCHNDPPTSHSSDYSPSLIRLSKSVWQCVHSIRASMDSSVMFLCTFSSALFTWVYQRRILRKALPAIYCCQCIIAREPSLLHSCRWVFDNYWSYGRGRPLHSAMDPNNQWWVRMQRRFLLHFHDLIYGRDHNLTWNECISWIFDDIMHEVHISILKHTYTYTYNHTSIRIYIYIYIYTYIHSYIHTYIPLCNWLCTTYTYIHTYIHIYIYIHTYIHICIYLETCVVSIVLLHDKKRILSWTLDLRHLRILEHHKQCNSIQSSHIFSSSWQRSWSKYGCLI